MSTLENKIKSLRNRIKNKREGTGNLFTWKPKQDAINRLIKKVGKNNYKFNQKDVDKLDDILGGIKKILSKNKYKKNSYNQNKKKKINAINNQVKKINRNLALLNTYEDKNKTFNKNFYENKIIRKICIGNEFVKLLPSPNELVNCKNERYTINALEAFKKYRNNLNQIKTIEYNPKGINDDILYIKKFMRQIWDNISNKQYPLYPQDAEYYENTIIYRPNHGRLNHLRSMKFGIKVIQMILKSDIYKQINGNETLFQKNHNLLIMLMCSTPFESIMRVDEQGSFYVLCDISKEYYNKLYPQLQKQFINSKASPHQIASSVLFTVLMEKCFPNMKYFIDILSRGVSYHWDGNNIQINNMNGFNIIHAFFIFHVIIMSGHYLDHCRGHWSKAIQEDHIQKLFELFGITYNKQVELVKYIIQALVDTEHEYFNGNINSIRNIEMKERCKKLKGRYDKNKLKYLTDFDKAWDVLDMNNLIGYTLQIANF